MRAGPCDHRGMSLFRKQPQTAAPVPSSSSVAPEPVQAPPPAQAERLFNGGTIDMAAIYRTAKLSSDELDRVVRAEGLLHVLPSKAANTREIVDATFHAFGVDRLRIVSAASKQLDALEDFVRLSQEHTRGVLDVGSQRIAELEAEIERFRNAAAKATQEGEERARTANTEMVKVQRVLDFFDSDSDPRAAELDLGDATGVSKHGVDSPSGVGKAQPPQSPLKAVTNRQGSS